MAETDQTTKKKKNLFKLRPGHHVVDQMGKLKVLHALLGVHHGAGVGRVCCLRRSSCRLIGAFWSNSISLIALIASDRRRHTPIRHQNSKNFKPRRKMPLIPGGNRPCEFPIAPSTGSREHAKKNAKLAVFDQVRLSSYNKSKRDKPHFSRAPCRRKAL